jgi:peptide/nickel transport system substrate-binding protein
LKAAALAAPTAEEANKLWTEAAQEMINNKIIIPMASPDLILAYGPNVKGVRYSACCNLPLAEITN